MEQSFRINLRVMRIFHLYPPEESTRWFQIRAYVMHLLFVMPVPTLGILYLLLEDNLDIERVNYNAAFLAQTTCFITKILPFIRNGQRIKQCIMFFESPFFALKNDQHKIIMNNCIKICQRNTLIFFIFVIGSVGTWSTKPLFWQGRNLPVDVWLPFSTVKATNYYFIYIFLVTGVFYTSFCTGVIDPLIAGLAYHATSQVIILKDNLQHLGKSADEQINRGNTNIPEQSLTQSELIYNKIRQCIRHHNLILKFVKEYEECFSSSVFSQIAASVFVIGFSCLQLSKIQSFGYYFLQLVTYFGVILAEIYFYCYYGTTLAEESNTLTNAIYMGNWYNYDVKSRKALITLMEGAKQPMTVTAGKIIDLSLSTFVAILKKSYSLIAVLKNYQ
ncbi:odorant receptor Or1-like [Tenebrio molitor]|uniref:odorant receptor Or1-like n=1 Tax=Tenebrio molitor TaxID=7067 RepID=UPI0036248B20